ncbi:MAG TPA: tRNA (guanosine(37)-N1)-methyltransferase TrmD [Candidatus Paceibacterota bacterium]|jgi:tRNA (guanine37-N1)-methyltransferase|nr:tRNA (guanosine(37)-N1)-methyltransferase TrmD [Candidatus Paceibacterota bacterium]
MKFHFLTIFPEIIESYTGEAMLKRASAKKLVSFDVKNIREYTLDKHNKTDERPYGGGPGMVMTPEPILRAHSKLKMKGNKTKVVMLSPSGKLFDNKMAAKWAKQYSDIVFICGRYEGVDDRVRKILKADEISVGDFVLTGGELPALVMTDAIARQIPGVLGDALSIEESRTASPHVYTRPEVFVYKKKKYKVPDVLLSGDHKKIDQWRESQKK